MKVQFMYILSKWAYKLLRSHIVEVVEDKLKPHWTVMILYELDEFFGYSFKCGDGYYDNHEMR